MFLYSLRKKNSLGLIKVKYRNDESRRKNTSKKAICKNKEKEKSLNKMNG